MNERKIFLDNIRWLTIFIVVVFHVFFYYNNIGTEPMFARLPENSGFTFAGIFQYGVYQWFMLLLFIVSGICAKYSLQKTSLKEFLRSRARKLLVPSVLGVLCFHWTTGYLIGLNFLTGEEAQGIPIFVKIIIYIATGSGQLWFCHVLFVACLLLGLIRVIDKNDVILAFFSKKIGRISVAVIFLPFCFFLLWGSAQILNMPKITTYRMLYYPMSFLLGYYIFADETLQSFLKKFGWIFLAAGIVTGVFYVRKFYGVCYSDYSVLNNWLSILHAYLFTVGILGAAQVLLKWDNALFRYFSKCSFGVYILHIFVMVLVNTLLKSVVMEIPVWAVYVIELVSGLGLSIALWEIFHRIPVVRYVLFGIKKNKNPSLQN